MFTTIREKLIGYKTYILIALAVLAVWIDYFFGLGLSDLCKGSEVAEAKACAISLKSAVEATFGLLVAGTIRAGVTNEVKKLK